MELTSWDSWTVLLRTVGMMSSFRLFVPIVWVQMTERLGYQPSLDGVRAVSIALVLVFHLGAPWLPGGYLGVSVFFTLSGFLITSLLLSERANSGRIDVRAFYVRRLRRLLPASLLCLTGIAVLASVGTIAARSDLRLGVLGAVLQVANWEQLLGNQSYADLFLAPSPVDHFWSLAIEEQFYWVWPLAIAGLTAMTARRIAHVLMGAFVALGVGALVTAQVLGGDAAYFASWARFAEIVAGAALAALLHGRRVPARAAWLAVPCLVAVCALAVVTPSGRGWAYEGGLPLFAVLSSGLVLGVLAPGPVASLLAREPIPWIGRISYGLYLFHWPVFTTLGDSGVVPKVALTFALTVGSYYVIERPVRVRRVLQAPPVLVGAAAGAVAAVAAVALVVVPSVEVVRTAEPVVISATSAITEPLPVEPVAVSQESPSEEQDGVVVAAPERVAPVATTVPPPAPPTVVALFGDSVADWLVRDAAPTFARTDITLVDAAIEGCDGARSVPAGRGRSGQILPLPNDCAEWSESYARAIEHGAVPVDVAVLMVGYAPMVDRQVGGRWVGPCDTLSWYADDVVARVAYLRDHVDRVVLAVPSWGGRKASFFSTDDHLDRMTCIRTSLLELAARTNLATVDLAELLCPAGPHGECSALREADGAHVDADDAPAVLEWLLDRVI